MGQKHRYSCAAEEVLDTVHLESDADLGRTHIYLLGVLGGVWRGCRQFLVHASTGSANSCVMLIYGS